MLKTSLQKLLTNARYYTKQGEIEKARELYNAASKAFPKSKRVRQGLAQLDLAKPIISEKQVPKDLIDELARLYNQRKFNTVVERGAQITKQYPDAFIIWNILGAANSALGRMQIASEAFEKVIQINPKYADGFNNLGVVLQNQGKLDEAIKAYKSALSLKPEYADAHNNMANALKNQSKLNEAIKAYKKAVNFRPDYPEAYFNMGNTFTIMGEIDQAIASYQQALLLKPNYVEAYRNIGAVLQEQGKSKEAITFYRKALSLRPDYAEVYNNIGTALQDQRNLGEALASYQNALSLRPDYAEVYFNMGTALQEQGKLGDAISSYRKVLNLNPEHTKAHRHISLLLKYQPEDPQITSVGDLLKRNDMRDNDRCQLYYTYAKMKEDLGEFHTAYNNYVEGGRLKKKLLNYEFSRDVIKFQKIKNTASKLNNFTLKKPSESINSIPIFILGMPRSGTTLVEQIISSHSQVSGAGELQFMDRFGSSLYHGDQKITAENVLQFRNSYLHELEKISNGHLFVTDKMPHNFLSIALILTALPEAKIVHVKRNPQATCWSNFTHYFSTEGLGYSYDLKETVKYFMLYRDLMHFWESQYSKNIYHLDYEKLVLEQETETINLIEYLGLNWENGCLSPQNNRRIVKTASQQQVKRKVYPGSSDAWHKYEPYIQGIFEKLQENYD